MNCAVCEKEAPADFGEVVEAGWIPCYFVGQQQMEGPVCPECCERHLCFCADGEWEMRVKPSEAHRYN
jgi:hypothetical protein